MDVVAAAQPTERSRFITFLGWALLALGALAPVRLAVAFYDVRSALYCTNTSVRSIYELVLGLLAASSGWGLIRRRRWAPPVLSVTAGALIALSAGSVFVVALKFMQSQGAGNDPQVALTFLMDRGGFAFLNASLMVASLMGLTTLFKREIQQEFAARHARPVALAAVALLSCVSWLGLNWYFWVHYVR